MIGKPQKVTPGSPCPTCGKVLDGCSGVNFDKKKPKPGDMTVCVYCSTILRWQEDRSFKAVAPEDVPEPAKEDIAYALYYARLFRVLKKAKAARNN